MLVRHGSRSLSLSLSLSLCRKLQILFLRRCVDKVCDQRHVRRNLCSRCDCGYTNDAVRLHVRAETHVQSKLDDLCVQRSSRILAFGRY